MSGIRAGLLALLIAMLMAPAPAACGEAIAGRITDELKASRNEWCHEFVLGKLAAMDDDRSTISESIAAQHQFGSAKDIAAIAAQLMGYCEFALAMPLLTAVLSDRAGRIGIRLDPATEMLLRFELAACHERLGGYAAANAVLDAIPALLASEEWTAPARATCRFQYYLLRSQSYSAMGRPDQARAALALADGMAAGDGGKAELLSIYHYRLQASTGEPERTQTLDGILKDHPAAMTRFMTYDHKALAGDIDGARRYLEGECAQLLTDHGRSHAAVIRCLRHIADALLLQGRDQEAVARLEAARSGLELVHHRFRSDLPLSLANILLRLAQVYAKGNDAGKSSDAKGEYDRIMEEKRFGGYGPFAQPGDRADDYSDN